MTTAKSVMLQPNAITAQRIPTGTPPYPVRRFSVDEYHALADAGILTSGDPYELLDGWIVPKMTKNPPHETCLMLLTQAMQQLMPVGWHYRPQTVITLSTSEPEPDGMIARGQPRDYVARHPTQAEVPLVIEIADSSLGLDRQKAALYARDRIARYWIVNLVDRVIEDYTHPIGRAGLARYRTSVTIGEGESVSFLLDRKSYRLAMDDILP